MKTYTGSVKWYNPTERYGYLEVAPAVKSEWGIPAGKDLYFHVTGLIGRFPKPTPEAGQAVQFNVEKNSRGPRAINVILLTPDPSHLTRRHD